MEDVKNQESKNRIEKAFSSLIEDLQKEGELSDEQLQRLAGGAGNIAYCVTDSGDKIVYMHTSHLEASSSTFNNDTDYQTVSDRSQP